jgi:hypothetical protein
MMAREGKLREGEITSRRGEERRGEEGERPSLLKREALERKFKKAR